MTAEELPQPAVRVGVRQVDARRLQYLPKLAYDGVLRHESAVLRRQERVIRPHRPSKPQPQKVTLGRVKR